MFRNFQTQAQPHIMNIIWTMGDSQANAVAELHKINKKIETWNDQHGIWGPEGTFDIDDFIGINRAIEISIKSNDPKAFEIARDRMNNIIELRKYP
ncbi:hypothetical protein AJ78_07410, partial [Emergomyces pasteurianus Ep9510]